MKFITAVLASAFAGAVMAIPASVPDTPAPYIPCSDPAKANCCSADVGEILDVDCATPTTVPTSAEEFQKTCAAVGKNARCCVLAALDQGALCQTPNGVAN
ncbi:fungal hydrophobin [Paecilomyces variotii]|nr:fungal hydrophobin [Paecilomyces variotii]